MVTVFESKLYYSSAVSAELVAECHSEVWWFRICSGGCRKLSLEFPVAGTWLCVTAEGAGAIPEQRRRISVCVCMCTAALRGKH